MFVFHCLRIFQFFCKFLIFPELFGDQKDWGSRGREFKSRHSDQDVLMKDATQKTPHESAVFLHLYRLFSGGKVRKSAFFGKSVFPRERRHFRDAAGRFYGLV